MQRLFRYEIVLLVSSETPARDRVSVVETAD
jgi:hypothetical protein